MLLNQFEEAKMLYSAKERLQFINKQESTSGSMSVQNIIASARYQVLSSSSMHKTNADIQKDLKHKAFWTSISLYNLAYNKILLKQAREILKQQGVIFPELQKL